MNIVLDVRLFDAPPPYHLLSTVLNHVLEGRHRLAISNDADPAFTTWLELHQQDKSDWHLAIDSSVKLEALEPSKRVVLVTPGNTDWSTIPPRLTLSDARKIAGDPFRVYLENSLNDRHFILAMASPEQRASILKHETDGTLRFDNGGGINNLLLILQAGSLDPSFRNGVGAIFDSDARQPGIPSQVSASVLKFCTGNGLWHHQLNRRSIENYLVTSALSFWTFGRPRERRRRKPIFDAFLKLNRDQRAHYNMKHGFEGDKPNAVMAGNLFQGLAPETLAFLNDGFGLVAKLFADFPFQEKHLRSEGMWSEMSPVISELLAMAR